MNEQKHSHLSPLVAIATLLAMALAPSLAHMVPTGGPNPDRHKSHAAVVTAPLVADSDSLSHNDRRRYDYFFLEAVCRQAAGDYDAAFDLLAHCLEIDPNAAEAYFLQSAYYAELRQDSMALHCIEKAAALRPGNDSYQERVAQYYIGANSYARAIDAYERLYAHHRDRSDILNVLVQLYRHEKDYTNMLRCLELMEQTDGPSEELALAKMNAYELKGDSKQAYRQLKALVDSHPVEVNYKVMLGNWLMQNDRKGDAYKLFVEAVDADPDNEYALSSMYDYYRQAGKDSLAVSLRDRLLLSPKTAAKTKVTMLQQVINDNRAEGGDSTRMLALFDRMISANPRDTEAMILKSAYMSMVNMPADSIIHMQRQILAITPDNADSRLQLLQHLWPQKKWDEIIKESTQAIQYNPDEMAFYYFLGLAHYQQNDEDDALDAFRRGVGEITAQSDPGIVSDFYALMGDILHGKGKVEEAFAAYDSCLQWKEDNISCLNNYAYYLSVLGKNLTKAEEMSYRTVKAEPNNATYLDTYAWILYQQKRYAEARIYIDQAVKNDTDTVDVSAVVTEHAGDIYLMTGSTDEAVGFWQKAIERGGDKVALEAKIRKARSAKGKNSKDNSKRK